MLNLPQKWPQHLRRQCQHCSTTLITIDYKINFLHIRKKRQLLNIIIIHTDKIIINNRKIKKLATTTMPKGSSLFKGMGEGHCTQPYPCICKGIISRFKPMTNQSPRHIHFISLSVFWLTKLWGRKDVDIETFREEASISSRTWIRYV